MPSHLSRLDTIFNMTIPNFVDNQLVPFLTPIVSKMAFPVLGLVTNCVTIVTVFNLRPSDKNAWIYNNSIAIGAPILAFTTDCKHERAFLLGFGIIPQLIGLSYIGQKIKCKMNDSNE